MSSCLPNAPILGIDISKTRDDAESASSRNRPLPQSQKDPSISRRETNELEGEGEYHDKEFQREEHPDKVDRELELDDPRQWRDDGKREERMALAREKYGNRDYREREREKSGETWNLSNRNNRRWANLEEQRDTRSKRSAPRERRLATTEDDTRERDDGRSREKEKQPAWMEPYIPKGSGGNGFGQGTDGIRVWKESLKEKTEKQESVEPGGDLSMSESADHTSHPMPPPSEKPLDEIQLFKLLMRQEEEKKKSSLVNESSTDSVKDSGPVPVEVKSPGVQMGELRSMPKYSRR
jgi:hypothetical protein